MSLKNDPNYFRNPIYNYGTKTVKTDSGIEYSVEYISEDKRQTRLLWFKESGKFIRLNAKTNCEEEVNELT